MAVALGEPRARAFDSPHLRTLTPTTPRRVAATLPPRAAHRAAHGATRTITMLVGLCEVTLRLRGVRSLKDKRSIVKRIAGRLRSRFNLAVTEAVNADQLRAATFGFALVATDGRDVMDARIDAVIQAIDAMHLGERVRVQRELLTWSQSPYAHHAATPKLHSPNDSAGDDAFPDAPWAEDDDSPSDLNTPWLSYADTHPSDT